MENRKQKYEKQSGGYFTTFHAIERRAALTCWSKARKGAKSIESFGIFSTSWHRLGYLSHRWSLSPPGISSSSSWRFLLIWSGMPAFVSIPFSVATSILSATLTVTSGSLYELNQALRLCLSQTHHGLWIFILRRFSLSFFTDKVHVITWLVLLLDFGVHESASHAVKSFIFHVLLERFVVVYRQINWRLAGRFTMLFSGLGESLQWYQDQDTPWLVHPNTFVHYHYDTS